MDGFQTQVVVRLPLAEATYRVLSHVLRDELLAEMYALYRGHGYELEISFPRMVWLIHDALFVHPSARQAIEKARESGRLSAANCSVYQKLGRMNPSLSMALVRMTSAALAGLLPQTTQKPALPASLDALDSVVIDGKTIKHVVHRLKVARPFRGKVTSGKFLAALSMRGELVLAMEATPDSCSNDVPLVPGLLAQLSRREDRPILFIADRQFGGVRVPLDLCRGGNHFLIRLQSNVGFEADPAKPAGQGVDEQGRTYAQDWGWIGAGRGLYGRRIRLSLSQTDDLILTTDLLDDAVYPAVDLLAAYRERWTIERVFQQVTEVYELRQLIGSTPQGTIFQAAWCVLMYNVMQVIKAHVAAGGKVHPRQVSGELLFDDATAQMTTWNTLLTPEQTVQAVMPPMDTEQLRYYLGGKLGPLWTPRWLKSPKKKPTKRDKKQRLPEGAICVHRVQQAEKTRQAQAKRRPDGQTGNDHIIRSPT